MQVKGSLDSIRRINKTIVHEDGTWDSFAQQLQALDSGTFDVTKPLIVSPDSACLSLIVQDVSTPITMRVKTIQKLREKHGIDLSFISQCPKLLENAILAFDSLSQDTSKVVLLDAFCDEGDPYIAVIRLNRLMSMVLVHEITSIYPKRNIGSFLTRTYQADKSFYKNKKTERSIKSHRLQLPKEMTIALSKINSNDVFTKSQVERLFHPSPTRKAALDQTIRSAALRRTGSNMSEHPAKSPER